MSKSVPPRIAELENCRKVLLHCIAEADKLVGRESKELRTLAGALKHVEQELSEYRSAKRVSKEGSNYKRKKPAA